MGPASVPVGTQYGSIQLQGLGGDITAADITVVKANATKAIGFIEFRDNIQSFQRTQIKAGWNNLSTNAIEYIF